MQKFDTNVTSNELQVESSHSSFIYSEGGILSPDWNLRNIVKSFNPIFILVSLQKPSSHRPGTQSCLFMIREE